MKKCYQQRKVIAIMLFLFLTVHFGAIAQSLSLQGTVKDVKGVPLPGVSISIVGTTQGTITDIDGNYSLEAPGDSQLKFQFIGFLAEIVSINNKNTINVTLKEDVVGLSEVIVIGYGTQRKEAVTGSVASMRGDEMRSVPSSNITQALQGRMPGVELLQTSTKPGASMQIRIRGTRSLTASNDPLIVLDGIPFSGSISDISPSNIKSLDILKDASATAIYGSRGANGVILVTSNKGRKGQKAKISYSGYYGIKNAIDFPMMNGPQLSSLREAAGKYGDGIDESADMNTDWQDLLYRTAKVTNHDIDISGGTEKGTYNFGVGYYLDQAVIPTQEYSRIALRGSVDQEIGNYVRVGINTASNYNVNKGNQIGLYGMLSLSPLVNPYNEDGSWKRVVQMPLDNTWIYPEEIINKEEDRWLSETRGLGSYNSLYAEVIIPGIEGLKYRANVGLNFNMSNVGKYTGVGIDNSNPETVSSASISNSLKTNWVIENVLTYDRTFSEKHRLNVVALYSAEQTKYNKSAVSAKDIPEESFQFYNLGSAADVITVDPNNQLYWKSGLKSWMGRAMYSYDDRYMLSATLRSDGASVLADGHKWHTYSAVSAGWNIVNESFMNNIPKINNLKLRMGYGQTANQAVSAYSTLGYLKSNPYNYGDTFSTGYYVEKLPNQDLGWEYSETMNYGLDFSILNNRLSGVIEYYVTNTKDLLQSVNLPQTSGVKSYTANVGETQNKGFELSLNGVILDNKNGWSWEAGINLYANHNEIVKLASGAERDVYNQWFVGHSINSVYDYKKIGLWQEGDSYMDILEPGKGAEPGMIKVQYTGEYNEDGTPVRAINSDDKQVIDLDPDFQGGFNTRVAYKGFDLSVVGTFKSGGTLISTLYSSSGYLNLMSGRRGNVDVDYWTPENTDAKYPNPKAYRTSDNPEYGSTLGYFDASYVKIRTITIGYDLSKKWTKLAGIEKLRIYCTAQNPFVLFSPYHKESGMDPETNSYGDENAAVTDNYRKRTLTVGASTPATKNFLIGMKLSF